MALFPTNAVIKFLKIKHFMGNTMISKVYKTKISLWTVVAVITALLITVSAVFVKQSFLRVYPLYVSVVIMLLMSRLNRYAYLIGGLNSISYGFIFLHYGIVGSAISALLFSFPLQIISFIRWSKTSWKSTTVLKAMSSRVRILNAISLVFVWIAYYSVIKRLGSVSSVIDSMSSLIGIYVTVLQALKFCEYTVLMIPSGIFNIILYASLIADGSIEQLPFLIYSLFSLCCIVRSVFSARKIYKEQNISEDSYENH